ncbi:coiled-coil domain-containing protein 108 isoform A [Alligator mississippiensis]|uniref:Coiled-coil domain-containing protein 108 isoform A n=2 Tax=Alligator mississippiensis TaxID=8496 RepID=A0A151MI65_ALLMI|nr:coiled-coil domain-containing protein 108 isoform A [Alligator mississippiensis]
MGAGAGVPQTPGLEERRRPNAEAALPPIVLSPGMSLTLPIVFRPLEKREYEDCICFEKPEGEFSVALRATLPRHALLCPDTLQLPTCAAYHFSEATFPLRNVGDLITIFIWEVPSPFHLVPTSGLLEPGAVCTVKVLFQPQVALAYDVMATCRFGDDEEQNRMIQLRASAKYLHLVVKVLGEPCEDVGPGGIGDVLCFGAVAVGTTIEAKVEICNPSTVSAPFRIERAREPLPQDNTFTCPISRAVVPARGKLLLPVRFSPQTVGVQSVDYFSVVPAGGLTRAVLKVMGSCKGPLVCLSQSALGFNWLLLGERSAQSLEISNISDVPAHYQFDLDGRDSVFSVDHPCGVLEGQASLSLMVTFRPSHPIIYYRRVACLVHHQDPLFLDLFGTCHSDTAKPPILGPQHLAWYRTHVARGLTFYPPDILGTMLQEGKLQVDHSKALRLPPQASKDSPLETYTPVDAMTEYLHDGVSSDLAMFPPHVSISIQEFDFGCCLPPRGAQPLPLCVTNHTKGTVAVAWTQRPERPFQVAPTTCDIPPLKSTAFRVTFQPPQPNALYAAELEGFAYYKVLRHYSNVEEDVTLCPSWCLTLRLQAHTFEPGQQHFIPAYILDAPQTFPVVDVGTSTYRSALLQNTGPSPLTFTMDSDSCPSVTVKPRSGYIVPGAHQIFLFSTQPMDATPQQHKLALQLNACPQYTQEISLESSADPPRLLLEGDGRLYFKPTCVGASSTRLFTIKNCSRLPLYFGWRIQPADGKVLAVKPSTGFLQPNEALAQTWTFTPREETRYLLHTWVSVWRENAAPTSPKSPRYLLRVIGEGALGAIRAQEEQLDLGNILVGSLQRCDLVLLNDGICSLNYVLSVEQTITGPCDPEEVLDDPLALELGHYEGRIPARSKAIVQVTASPTRQLHYTWAISYAIATPQAGSASGISKLHLWRLFCLDTLNQYLAREPTPVELTYSVPTRHSAHPVPPVHTPVLLDFDFGAAPLDSAPSMVILMLENQGTVPADWAFLFPADQKIDMEHWAEDVELGPCELHHMRVQDNQLFDVSPRAGHLLPGQEQPVQLMHRHDFLSTDCLPVLLKVSHGREVLLNFVGMTVQRGQPYLHITTTRHVFTPVAIGSPSPPKQVYELYNGGSVPVCYEIPPEPMQRICEENFQHPVFVCLNPKGQIGPGTMGHIEWVFSPLEARTYSVDVSIHVAGGESALVTFQGIGYDPHITGDTARFDTVSSPLVTPGSSKLTLPGQAAFLSQSRICLGNIPVYSKTSRLFFLNNPSEDQPLSFTWHVGTGHNSALLKISPERGSVLPGDSVPCILTLQALGTAAFYTVDLVCEVFSQQALATYEAALQAWEAERARQATEFTITERDLEAQGGPEPPAPKSASSSGLGRPHEPPAVSYKFKTLPPIETLRAPHPPASRSQRGHPRSQGADVWWARPEPPQPLLLHLGMTARFHAIDDFLASFSDDFPKHFLCRPLKELAEGAEATAGRRGQGATGTECVLLALAGSSEQEQQVVMDLLAMVIRGLLEDTRFHEAVSQGLAEPTPYFCQLRSEESAPRAAGPPSLGSASAAPPSPGSGTTVEPGAGEEEEQGGPEVPQDLQESLGEILHREQVQEQKEAIARLPAFRTLAELVLENTLQNILHEASRGEVVLTARPRVIALPPATPRRGTSPSTPSQKSMTVGARPEDPSQSKDPEDQPLITLTF